MRQYLVFVGTWLIIQPSFIFGLNGTIIKEINQVPSKNSNLPATIEYQNDQVIITNPNQKKRNSKKIQADNTHLNDLENYLGMLEAAPSLVSSGANTTQLGLKMRNLSKSILFTG